MYLKRIIGSLSAMLTAVALFFVFTVGCGDDGNPSSGTTGAYYETVTIGTQTWMKKNLNIVTADSWCYGDNPANCETYGRLYTWDAAMRICPDGWHLPTDAEWDILIDYVGGAASAVTTLKSQTGWHSDNGTDEFGFSALPGGLRYPDGYFFHVGYSSYWWSTMERDATEARSRYITENAGSRWNNKNNGKSVRCVRN